MSLGNLYISTSLSVIWEEITTVHKQKGYLHVKSFHFKSEYVKAMKERIVFRWIVTVLLSLVSAKQSSRSFFSSRLELLKRGTGQRGPRTSSWNDVMKKWGKKLILTPIPISNFIGNSLFCSHFLIFPLPSLVLRSPFLVPRFSNIPKYPKGTKKCILYYDGQIPVLSKRVSLVMYGKCWSLVPKVRKRCIVSLSVISFLDSRFCKVSGTVESGEFLLSKSKTLGFEVRNTAQGIRNPIRDRNPESTFH